MNLPATIVDYFLPFVLLLGVLIVIHELGHFAVAKWLGVKVEKFSVGFGPSLFSRKIGETEYVVAALPLGGFVKMLGELPGEELRPEEAGRAFNVRPVWQRIAISLAGPAMNMILPVFLIAAILMSGVSTPTSKVGSVVAGSPAERAGIQPGDRVVAVDGAPITWWEDLAEKLVAKGPAQLALSVEREGGEKVELPLAREQAENGEWKDPGLSWHVPQALFGVGADTPAAQAGMKTGDRVTALNGAPVANAFALQRALADARPPVELELTRPLDGDSETVRVTVRELATPTLAALGLTPIGVAINGVDPSSPAKSAGLRGKDVVLRVGPALATSPDSVREAIWASGGKPIDVEILRGDAALVLSVVPTERPIKTATGTETHYGIGITLGVTDEGAEYRDDVESNPFAALARGVSRTRDIFVMIVGGIAQLVTGHVGMGSLSGPIGIGEIAADAYQESWTRFVWLMSVISVNLAILNLLPIPILDGGQIVLAAAEGIKGSPLPARARDIAQTVGLSLILLLMGVAFWNDIARHWSGVVSFLTNAGG